MPAPISLPAHGAPTGAIRISAAKEPSSILTALPFRTDPDQAWAQAHWKVGEGKDPGAASLRRQVQEAVSTSLTGMTAKTSHWRGARADTERSSSYNLDRALITSGLVHRLTAHISLGPNLQEWMENAEAQDRDSADFQKLFLGFEAYIHAKSRAGYKIGKGLFDAAEILLSSGILAEAECLYGAGPNRPERLLIRDAVFASEDITLEEMAKILVGVPYQLAEGRGERAPLWKRERMAMDDTPLIFVQCRGVERTRCGPSHLVLEAIDFQTIDNLNRCLSVMRNRDLNMHEDARNLLLDAYEDYPVAHRRSVKRGARRRV